MKYLGFFLRPKNYRVNDWLWLLKKIEKRIRNWTFRWLSLGCRLTLANSSLQSIPVYWISLVKLPSSILHRIQLLLTNFIWKEGGKGTRYHLNKMEKYCQTKNLLRLGHKTYLLVCTITGCKIMLERFIWFRFLESSSLQKNIWRILILFPGCEEMITKLKELLSFGKTLCTLSRSSKYGLHGRLVQVIVLF